MEYARLRLTDAPGIHFARRVVTRPCDPASEAHDTLDEAGFVAAEKAGRFALSWQSHGLFYGIPRSIEEDLAAGRIVVANLSRTQIEVAAARFARVMPVMVKVSPAILAARLTVRGRESEAQIAARLARHIDETPLRHRCHILSNDRSLEEAGDRFVALLSSAMERQPGAHSSVTPPY